MLDPRLFRTELDYVTAQLSRRSFNFDPTAYSALETRRKDIQIKTQELQNERNSRSKAIGQAKAKGEDVQPLLDQVQHLGDELKAAEAELTDIQTAMTTLMESIPIFWMPVYLRAKAKKPMWKSAAGATCRNLLLNLKTMWTWVNS